MMEMDEIGLSCIICEQNFSDEKIPRNLTCGHSFCTHCIDQFLQTNQEKRCPECRQELAVNSSSGLSVNYPLLRLARSCIESGSNAPVAKTSLPLRPAPLPPNKQYSRTSSRVARSLSEINPSLPTWRENPSEFICAITSPKKISRYGGLKSEVCYSIIPSYNSKRVMRTHGEIEWLRNQLTERYPLNLVPLLPKKEARGLHREEATEHSRYALQTWINRICRHPVVSQSELFNQFVATSNEKSWKNIKQKFINDRLINEEFFTKIKLPSTALDIAGVRVKFKEYDIFSKELAKALKLMHKECLNQAICGRAMVQNSNENISQVFRNFSQSSKIDEIDIHQDLPSIFSYLSEAYSDIAQMYGRKEMDDEWEFLMNLTQEHIDLLKMFNNIKAIAKKRVRKWKYTEYEAITELIQNDDTDLETLKLDSIERSTEAILAAHAFQAEALHFQKERNTDIKIYMKSFLHRQVKFYHGITSRLERCLAKLLNVEKDIAASSNKKPGCYKAQIHHSRINRKLEAGSHYYNKTGGSENNSFTYNKAERENESDIQNKYGETNYYVKNENSKSIKGSCSKETASKATSNAYGNTQGASLSDAQPKSIADITKFKLSPTEEPSAPPLVDKDWNYI
ncbi:hypothetical protein SK128_021666 [Halocaridina rubra]|uniref:RING-type domain-containing protein n=1 Tax=Halocaridina rubra TaxID=373956 RepID=A0AAN9A209_HALRR